MSGAITARSTKQDCQLASNGDGAQIEPDTSEEKSGYQATKSAEQKQDKHLTTP
jgi:hypothetical protein